MSTTLSRRAVLTKGGLGLMAASGVLSAQRHLAAEPQHNGDYTLPPLSYAFDWCSSPTSMRGRWRSITTSITRLMFPT